MFYYLYLLNCIVPQQLDNWKEWDHLICHTWFNQRLQPLDFLCSPHKPWKRPVVSAKWKKKNPRNCDTKNEYVMFGICFLTFTSILAPCGVRTLTHCYRCYNLYDNQLTNKVQETATKQIVSSFLRFHDRVARLSTFFCSSSLLFA